MSVQDIRRQLMKMSQAEQAEVARFLKVLQQTHSSEFRRELARRHREMDAGNGITLTELKRRLRGRPREQGATPT